MIHCPNGGESHQKYYVVLGGNKTQCLHPGCGVFETDPLAPYSTFETAFNNNNNNTFDRHMLDEIRYNEPPIYEKGRNELRCWKTTTNTNEKKLENGKT